MMLIKQLINFITLTVFTWSQVAFSQAHSNSTKLDDMGKLYDPNCHSFIKEKDYVRIGKRKISGKTEENLYMDLDQRTERYLNWGTYAGKSPKGLTYDYLELIKSEELKNTADKRYSEWNPLRPPPSLALCEDSPTQMNNCLAFKVYCTEQVATRGMEETLQEYADQVHYCSNYYYSGDNAKKLEIARERQEKYPDRCKADLAKRGRWLQEHAKQVNKVAKDLIASDRNVDAYFKEASDTFGKYAGDMEALLNAQKEAQALKEQQDKYEKDLKTTKQAIKNCNDVVRKDDNDVKGHQVAGYVMGGLQCSPQDSLKTLSPVELDKLSKDINKINIEAAADEIDDSVNKAALRKTAMAIWASYELMADAGNKKDLAKDKAYAIDELICKYGKNDKHLTPAATQAEVDAYNKQKKENVARMGGFVMPESISKAEFQKMKDAQEDLRPSLCTPDNKKILEEAHREYAILSEYNPIKYLDNSAIDEILQGQFAVHIAEIEKQCKEIKKDFDLISKETDRQINNFVMGIPDDQPMTADTLHINDSTKLIIPKYENHRRMSHGAADWGWTGPEGPIAPMEVVDIQFADYKEKKIERSKFETPFANHYSAMIQTKLGNLLITDSFQKAVGTKPYEEVYQRCTKGQGTGFKVPSVADVNQAKKDFIKLQKNELIDIGKQLRNPKDRIENIQKYLKNNPITIAEMLEQNPSEDYAYALCAFIRDINADDAYWQNVKMIAAPVGLVAGVALAITGFGAPAGAGLIGWVAGAGLVAATSFEVSAFNRDINQADQKITASQQAAATLQTFTEKAIEDVKNAKEEKESAEFWLPLVIVFAAVDIIPAGYIRMVKNFTKTNKGKAFLKLNKVSKYVEGSSEAALIDKNLQRGAEAFKAGAKKHGLNPDHFKHLSSEDQHFLFGIIGKMDDVQADAFIKKLNTLENPAQVDRFLELVARDIAHFVDGKGAIKMSKLDWALGESQKYRLANGTDVDEFFQKNLSKADEIQYPANHHKLLSQDEYAKMLKAQESGEVLELDKVVRPGIAKVNKSGSVSIVQGSGRYEKINNIEYMDIFLPSGSKLPDGAIVLEKGVNSDLVFDINMLSSRGSKGANPEFLKTAIKSDKYDRVLILKSEVKAPYSQYYHQVDDMFKQVKKVKGEEYVQALKSDSAFQQLNSIEQLAYLEKQLDAVQDLEKLIQEGKVIETTQLSNGSGGFVIKVKLDNGVEGIFKTVSNEYETYQREVAYYKLNNLMEFNVAPHTSLKTIDGAEGSFQHFVKNGTEALPKEFPTSPDIKLLDFLTGEIDRPLGGSNFMKMADGTEITIDNARLFQYKQSMHADLAIELIQSEKNYTRLKELNNIDVLNTHFKGLLSDQEIITLKENMNKMIKLIDNKKKRSRIVFPKDNPLNAEGGTSFIEGKKVIDANKINYQENAGSFILKGDDSAIGKYVRSMNDKGVEVVYDPNYLNQRKVRASFDVESNRIYLDHQSIINAKPSTSALHETTHWHRFDQYLKGVDDQYNLTFQAQNQYIYAPDKEFFKKYLPHLSEKNFYTGYQDYMSAQEMLTFGKNMRQSLAAGKVDVVTLEKSVGYAKYVSNATVHRVEDALSTIEMWKKSPAMFQDGAVVFGKSPVNGKEMTHLEITLRGKPGPGSYAKSSDVKMKMLLVTEEQFALAKEAARNPTYENYMKLLKNVEEKLHQTKQSALDLNKHTDEIWEITQKGKNSGNFSAEQYKRLVELSSETSLKLK